jgi:hypothetical protein
MTLQHPTPNLTLLDEAVVQAILVKLETDEAVARHVAEIVAPYLPQLRLAVESSGWLDFNGAVAYLGMKRGTLYKLTSARTVPFHQDGPGSKLWFLRTELDDWRFNGGRRRQARSAMPQEAGHRLAR